MMKNRPKLSLLPDPQLVRHNSALPTRRFAAVWVALLAFIGLASPLQAQLTGVRNIPGDYATFMAAVTDLNTQGVGTGGLTINIAPGYTETGVAAVLTMATNSPNAANPLVIRRNPIGAGANPLLTAGVGTGTTDGIVKLNGVDWVTFDGIDLQEDAANVTTTTQMEWGYALVKVSATNGSQNNTIKNATVTLNKTNTATIGIYIGNHIATSTTGLTVTSFLGTSSYNRFFNNTVQNSFQGIVLNGFGSAAPFDFFDQGNQVGVDGVSINPNRVRDFGGGTTGTANGIATANQNNLRIFNTSIDNTTGTATATTINGILVGAATNASVDIYNNTVTLTSNATASTMIGINNLAGGTGAGSVINIYGNTITNCALPLATSAEFRGISHTSTASYSNVYNNTISNTNMTGSGTLSAIYMTGSSVTLMLNVDVYSNNITGNTRTGTTGNLRLLNIDVTAFASNVHDNIVNNNSNAASSGTTYAYYNLAGTGFSESVYNNQVSNLLGGSGETVAIYCASGPTTAASFKRVSGNTVRDVSANTTGLVCGIITNWSMNQVVYQNTVSRISNTSTTGGTPAVIGIQLGASLGFQCAFYNNFISELTAPNASNASAIRGFSLEGAGNSVVTAHHNTVYLNATSVGANFGTAAMFCSTTPLNIDLRNNIFVDASTPAGTGRAIAIQRSGTSLTNYNLVSGHNCLYAGTPGPNNVIFSDGTNNDQTLQAFKNRVGPREQASFSEIPPFVSLVSPFNLHLATGTPTQCESGGQPIASVTTDFDGAARNATTPDVGADEFGGTMVDIASPDIQYVLLTNSGVAPNRGLPAFATITDPSGINTTLGTRPRLYYKKSGHANTYADNTSATDGWKYVEASNTVSPFAFTIDYSLLFGGGGVVAGDIIQYFVTAQDLNATPQIGLNNGGFTAQPASVALSAANFPLNNTINQYTIVANTYSGVIPVGPAEAITSLTNAGGIFALLNAGVLSGNVTISITGDLTAETGANALNQWAEQGGSNYTVSIVPSAGVTRLISGTNTASLIRFDGADRVTVDGRFGGAGTFLTFRSTSTTQPVIGYINDAQNNTLRNCIIESGNTATTATAGGAVFIGSTTGLFGNDNITITANEIRDRSDVAGTPSILINCGGNTTTPQQFNSGVVISNNNLHDWYAANGATQNAIQVAGGNTNFTITGNSFYQTVTRAHTGAGATTRAINITNAVGATNQGGHDISGNFIGGSAPGATGADFTLTSTSTQVFIGISVTTGLAPSVIQNNVIRRISYTSLQPSTAASMFLGISVTQGNINVLNNTIGSATGTGSINLNFNTGGSVNAFLAGILSAPTNGTHNINGNTIGGWTLGGTNTAGGIIPQYIQYQGTPTTNFSISNNVIGSTTVANSIQNNMTTATAVGFGIRLLITTGPAVTISGNTIQNINDLSANTNSATYGILLINQAGGTAPITLTNNTVRDISASPASAVPAINVVGLALQGYAGRGHNFSGNTFSNISNPNPAASLGYVMGMQVQGSSAGGTMSRNRICDIRNANTGVGAGLAGIYLSAGDGWNLSNNMVSISNGAGTNDLALFGIADYTTGAVNLTYNTVYIGGSGSGAANSYAFARGATSRISVKNNLLYNERTSVAGFGYAIGNLGAAPADGWNSASSAYNTFVSRSSNRIGEWVAGTNQTFAQWKASSGGDIESYADTTANVPSASLFVGAGSCDLSINPASALSWYVNGKGIAGAPSGNIAVDFAGDVRGTTLGTPTDIGADEFTPNVGVAPIPALASAAPAAGTTTTYSFAGRRLGEITWGAAGTVPTAITWTYHSGVPGIGVVPATNINSYWDVAATGGTGYSYDLKSYYTLAEQNALADGSLNQGKKTGASAWFYYGGVAATNAFGKNYTQAGFNSFSQFTLGTNAISPNFTITATVISGTGTITPSGAVSVTPLNNQAFTIAAGPCHVIDSVFADGVYVGAVASYEFTDVAANHTIGVKFRNIGTAPTVTISALPGTTICAGTNVTFTATPTFGGVTPSYQWLLNGGNVGTNSATYSNNSLVNGDVITVELTSSEPCATPATVTSNALTISVVSSVTPSVTISTPSTTICPGASATFTAVAVNAGTLPSYQWKLNGGNVGTNSSTYTNGTLATGNQITVEVTSNDPCASPLTATSNTITMTVGDATAPVATCVSSVTVALNAAGTGSTTAAAVNNGSTDNCTASGSLTLGLSTTTFSCANLGSNTVTLTVTDAASNSGTCTATVNVVDNILPQITCPANISVNNDPGLCGAIVTYVAPTGTDNCTPTTTQTAGLASGANFPVGTTTNTFRVLDGSSNQATCSFTVSVTDNTPPTLNCPAPITVNNTTGVCGAVVNYSTPSAVDNCGAITTPIGGLPSGSTFPIGTTTNTYGAADAAGNTVTCSFTVTVVDAEAPAWSNCPANISAFTSASSCDAVVTWAAPSATDNCPGVTSTATHTSGSTFALGSTTVTYTATDAAGNPGTCVFTVTVTDNVAPTAICQAVTVNLDAAGNGSTTAGAVDNGSTDNCSVASVSLSQTAFTCANAGANTVTLTVTDVNGNSSTCTATVTVVAQAVTGTVTADTTTCGYNVSCPGGNDGIAHALGGGGCPGYTYLWSSGGTNATETGLSAGVHYVTITDGAGGTYVDSVTITQPAAIQVASAVTSSCFGDSTGTIDITVTGGNDCQGYTFLWSNGATTEDLNGVPAGNYSVTITDAAGCTSVQGMTVASFSQLNPTFTDAGHILTSDQTWSSYQWLLNGGPIAGANAISYTITQTGVYSLLVTDINGCSAVTDTATVIFVGMADPGLAGLEVSIYPNPARGEFRLRTAAPINYSLTVTITDMYGKRYVSQTLPELGTEVAFDLRAFAAGNYMVEVVTEIGQRKLFKLVVQ